MKTYSEVRKDLVERSGGDVADPSKDLLPCRFCGLPTKRGTLSTWGARCLPCVGQYQRLGYSGGQPAPQAQQAAWVKPAASKVFSVPGDLGSALAPLAERLHERMAERAAIPADLDEDAVNGLLQEASR